MIDMMAEARDEQDACAEDVFRAWNKLEEILNELEDMGQDPHLTSHIGVSEVHGLSGRVTWSETAQRWIRR